MSKYSLCIIDDKIPAASGNIDDTARLNSSNLKHLLSEFPWQEEQIKDLTEKILEKEEFWIVSAFTNPSFYINHFEDELYRPDIIVFDWEYPGIDKPVDDYLLDILRASFVIINVYTYLDKKQEIEDLLKTEPFKPFTNRVSVRLKGDEDSVNLLVQNLESICSENFSARFGNDLRKRSVEAVDRILLELGRVTLNQTSKYFTLSDDGYKDLIEFIGERFKNHLVDTEFEQITEVGDDEDIGNDEELLKQLWAYRLYYIHKEEDDLVRRGDVVRRIDCDILFFVVSGDCDLLRFWKNNFGSINLIPLHVIENNNEDLFKKILLTRKPSKVKKKISQTSLTSRISASGFPEGPFILPVLPLNNKYNNYLGFPKEISSFCIEPPEGILKPDLKEEPLKYSSWENHNRICSLSEPFLTPLMEHIVRNITGVGAPDYPEKLIDILKNQYK